MHARKLSPQERALLHEIQGIAFLYPYDTEAEKRRMAENPQDALAADAWGCFGGDGALVAGMENHPFSMRYDGHTVAAGGIGGVASLPESRMRGGIRLVFERVFEDDLKNGRLFSLLYPFSHSYYRKFGYELCHEARCFLFPTRALEKYKQTAAARMHRAEDGSAPFESVYARYAAAYNCAIVRDGHAWRRMLHGSPSKSEAYRYILSRDGVDTAYCMFRVLKKESQYTMALTDYAFVDRNALHDLLGFLSKLSPQLPLVHMEAPDGFEPSVLVEEPYDVKPDGLTRSMARVLDVSKALSLMRHPRDGGAYTLAVRDDFLPGNTGSYHVAYGADGVRVTRMNAGAFDLSLPVTTLSQLCLGFVSLDKALLKPDTVCGGNYETLRRVFVKKPGLLTDRF